MAEEGGVAASETIVVKAERGVKSGRVWPVCVERKQDVDRLGPPPAHCGGARSLC